MSSRSVSACIEEAEATLGVRLPASFRQYLIEVEPKEVEIAGLLWDIAPVLAPAFADPSPLHRSAIVAETANAREWDDFPEGGIAVGSDGCGNYLIFLQRELDDGLGNELYIWWHEGPELELVAKDVAELFPRPNNSPERTRER